MPGQKAKALSLKGVVLGRLGRWRESSECFHQVLELDPSGTHVPLSLAEIRRNLGEALLMTGEMHEAERQFRAALETVQTPQAELLYLIGRALDGQASPDEAREYWEKALACDGQFLPALIELGRYYVSTRETDRALEYLRRAESLAPNNSTVLYTLATLYRRLGKNELADQYLSKSNELTSEKRGL
ncbi:MAG: tetratricopeptide repeat protein [Planctomycetes bacterium]|nr:tetratricopeptide repeat protein [Planctomycetota bacterium]